MRPYRDVIIIGEKTNGKPFGMYVFDYDNTVLSPVSFESFNANDVSSSSEGLMPTILAQENLKNDFGDLGETCQKRRYLLSLEKELNLVSINIHRLAESFTMEKIFLEF